MTDTTKPKKRKNIIFGVITTILLIVFVLNVVMFFDTFDLYYTYDVSDSSLMYRLEEQDYESIYDYYLQDCMAGKQSTGDRAAIYAIGKYYHYSLLYHSITKAQDSGYTGNSGTDLAALASSYEKEMKEAAAGMGDFTYAKGDIDQLFE